MQEGYEEKLREAVASWAEVGYRDTSLIRNRPPPHGTTVGV